MSVIKTGNRKPIKRLFHNEEIDTYDMPLKFEIINYWPKNLRTTDLGHSITVNERRRIPCHQMILPLSVI